MNTVPEQPRRLGAVRAALGRFASAIQQREFQHTSHLDRRYGASGSEWNLELVRVR